MSFSFCKQLLVACVLALFSSRAASADENCTSVAELICDLDETNTLCELISASEPTYDFFSNQVVTLFAPTDDAWLTLDRDAIDDLVNCTAALNSIFAFHAVFGEEVSSSDLECKETITMANGDESRTVCRDGRAYQKGTSNSREMMPEIVQADVYACNGVVHLVDQVMLPKAKYVAVCDDEEEDEEVVEEELPSDVRDTEPIEDLFTEDMGNCTYIADELCSDGDLTTLCELVTEYELYELVDGVTCNCSWTVFAPTDAAFDAIIDVTSDLSRDEIADILMFHAVQFQELYFDDLQCKELIEMANGDDSRTKCDKDDDTKERFKVQKGAGQLDGMLPRITETIETCNGPIHKVDNVLLPKIDYPKFDY